MGPKIKTGKSSLSAGTKTSLSAVTKLSANTTKSAEAQEAAINYPSPQSQHPYPAAGQSGYPPPSDYNHQQYAASPDYSQGQYPPEYYQGQHGYPQQSAPPEPYYGQPQQPYYGDPNQAYYGADPAAQIPWMPLPQIPINCPPGLEYLSQVTALRIEQEVDFMQMVSGYRQDRRYKIKNEVRQQVYFAKERRVRECCDTSFTISITDYAGHEIIRVNKPSETHCFGGCTFLANFEGYGKEISVEAPIGYMVGYVKQVQSGLAPEFEVQDPERQATHKIVGPNCVCCCSYGQQNFPVSSFDGTQIGNIGKEAMGYLKERFTSADNFGVTFPIELDVRVKATLLGAVFLIDTMFFEESPDTNRRHGRRW